MIEILIVSAIIAILLLIIVPMFTAARAQSQLAACEGNLKNIATTLEMYAADNSGIYPNAVNGTLPPTTGNVWSQYSKANPVCSVTKQNYVYTTAGAPPAQYTLSHNGVSHSLLPANYPQYSSTNGLIVRP